LHIQNNHVGYINCIRPIHKFALIKLYGFINPLPDEQHFFAVRFDALWCTKSNKSCHFSSISIFCLRCKTVSRRAARCLIVLHPKHNIETELKRQTCSGTMVTKFSWSSGKGLISTSLATQLRSALSHSIKHGPKTSICYTAEKKNLKCSSDLAAHVA